MRPSWAFKQLTMLRPDVKEVIADVTKQVAVPAMFSTPRSVTQPARADVVS